MSTVARPPQIETRLRGLPLSDGVAVGRVCMFNERRHRSTPMYKVNGAAVDIEIARVRQAIEVAADRLDELEKKVAGQIGRAEAEIFVAQKMILRDEELINQVAAIVRERSVNAEAAVSAALDAYGAKLQNVEDDYLRERASDFGEIKNRLLDGLGRAKVTLNCKELHCLKGRNRIIATQELTPSLTVDLDTERTLGFVSERGGQSSHAAILARALGIPAVSGLEGIRDRVSCGTEILVNGTTGEVILWPREETITVARAEQDKRIHLPSCVAPVPSVEIMANINLTTDLAAALDMQAEGIGLYRTEFELMAAGRCLGEEELYGKYMSVLEAMDGRSTTFRLLDIGSDKPLPYLQMPNETNPSLGCRGARMLLQRAELLVPHARAMARASQHAAVRVLYPMITDPEQFQRIRDLFDAATDDLNAGSIQHGVMFEVPAACLEADALFEIADFASIGTNDLLQYLFAVDRNNVLVGGDHNPSKPAFWRMMRMVADAARSRGKPLSVCGEVAGDPAFLPQLLEIGVTSLSMSARRIPAVRKAAQTLAEAQSQAAQ